MQLSTTEHEQLYAILQQYDENPQVQRMREFIQHGDVTPTSTARTWCG